LQLSVIIVNFNVKYFLEQCICSLIQATRGIDTEIWVVDNASTDGSVEFIKHHFSNIRLEANEKNVGFAKANNQVLAKCTGDYVLYLNPDTLLAEDSIQKCLSFFDTHPYVGGLGIRMLDGEGKFLPESKRSFPTPLISLFKLVGLSALFPTSRFFAKYNLGNLPQHQTNEVDVLSGAFLMAPLPLLKKLQGFDETFFMYGEDVDLSYRIQEAGYKNYYFADSAIIHFKGESTRKGSLNYVRMFYQAMSIFVQKHYGGGKASIFSVFIQLAIWLRAGLSALGGIFLKTGLPLVDGLLIYTSFISVNTIWVNNFRGGDGYNPQITDIAFPAFSFIFLLSATLYGIYERKYKISPAFYSGLVSIMVMLACYSLLPERFRFSRSVILFSGVVATILMIFFRWLLLQWKIVDNFDEQNRQQQTLVVGTAVEYEEVRRLFAATGIEHRLMGRVAPNGSRENALLPMAQLPTLLESMGVKEIIFCQGYLSFKVIIQQLEKLPSNINVRFHAHTSQSIVGSDSKYTSGEFVSLDGSFELSQPFQLRRKRLLDLALAFSILITFPVHLLLCGGKIIYNALMVIWGKKTWVGYSYHSNFLPKLRIGVLATNGFALNDLPPLKKESLLKIDEWYARNYHWLQDVKLVTKHYKKLG